MRDQDRMRQLYARRRELRETARRLRNGGERLDAVRERQADNGMQLLMMRRRPQ